MHRKIERDPHDPEFIKTVRSGGYLFTPSVEPSWCDIRSFMPNRISGRHNQFNQQMLSTMFAGGSVSI